MKINIVWFKKDLRLQDNPALYNASLEKLPVLLIFVYEKNLLKEEDFSYRQLIFLNESLNDLIKECNKKKFFLNIAFGDINEIFNQIINKFQINKIFSNQETGNWVSFQRDKKVRSFLKTNNIIWKEYQQNGVIRGKYNRDGWSNHWYTEMTKPILPIPLNLNAVKCFNNKVLTAKELDKKFDYIENAQKGGRETGLKYLNSFLFERGENYTREMSSPLSAMHACSRISPYITFGCLSIKEIFQIASKRKNFINNLDIKQRGKWPSAFSSFLGRLRWHCHFIQKLEDEPEIEFENMHSNFDELDRTNDTFLFESWKKGQTGFPMIDACMRSLIYNGWINFRMRAMLASFASYHLWLDWRITSKYLASLFVDYEPGIHYSQFQMQSGTTGINTIRIYSPTKQVFDQDPEGIFIKKYVKELIDISPKNIATPFNEPLLINNYTKPIIDEKKARKNALEKIYSIKKTADFKNIAHEVFIKHGSRKSRFKKVKK